MEGAGIDAEGFEGVAGLKGGSLVQISSPRVGCGLGGGEAKTWEDNGKCRDMRGRCSRQTYEGRFLKAAAGFSLIGGGKKGAQLADLFRTEANGRKPILPARSIGGGGWENGKQILLIPHLMMHLEYGILA